MRGLVPTVLHGGPLDGKVADTSGTIPALVLSEPREMQLFDLTDHDSHWHATWNPVCGWYERTDA